MPLEPGQHLLHYRLIEKIGQGGMGVVWSATDTDLDRNVAIKVLPDALAVDAERLARFEREAKLLAALNHPNVAAIYGLHAAETEAGAFESYMGNVEELNQMIESVVVEEHVTLVDLFAAFGADSTLLQDDGLHPSSAGTDVIAAGYAASYASVGP